MSRGANIKDGVGRANHRRVREPPENLVVKHADGSGESLVVDGVVVIGVWQESVYQLSVVDVPGRQGFGNGTLPEMEGALLGNADHCRQRTIFGSPVQATAYCPRQPSVHSQEPQVPIWANFRDRSSHYR